MRLYDFQKKGLDRVKGKENVALYWDMGLGKTVAGFEQMRRFGGNLNLIVCQKSKMDDWAQHAASEGNVGCVAVIGQKHKDADIRRTIAEVSGYKIVVIVNYELLWRRPALSEVMWDTVMLDESSIIQNEKTKACRSILNLHHEHCILLSGTPCSGKYENLWSQAWLLGWRISRTAFDATYVNWEKFYVGTAVHYRPCKDDPYKNTVRLKKKLREYGADFIKTEEVMELPEQVIQTIRLDRSKDYDTFRKNRFVEFGEKPVTELIGDSIMAWRIGLRKLCAEHSQAKNEAVKDLLASSNGRFVVFYNWNTELQMLMTICEELKKPMSLVNGTDKDLAAYEAEEDSVTLVQYQAGAMGLNLQLARRVVYYSLPERSDLFEQSKKRIHRIGQEGTCFYYLPLTRSSIEESIYRCLEERRDYTDELFRKEVGYEAHK